MALTQGKRSRSRCLAESATEKEDLQEASSRGPVSISANLPACNPVRIERNLAPEVESGLLPGWKRAMKRRRCIYCPKEFDPSRGEGDHILPAALGEFQREVRFRGQCPSCNNTIGHF